MRTVLSKWGTQLRINTIAPAIPMDSEKITSLMCGDNQLTFQFDMNKRHLETLIIALQAELDTLLVESKQEKTDENI